MPGYGHVQVLAGVFWGILCVFLTGGSSLGWRSLGWMVGFKVAGLVLGPFSC